MAIDRDIKRWQALGTKISWCHWVWNWWTGCAKVSSGCKHCYAEGWAKRTGRQVWGRKADRPRTRTWGNVAKYRKLATDSEWRAWAGLDEAGERPRCFVGSLMDWAEARDDEQKAMVAEAWPIIREAVEIDFLMLTKRPQNIPSLLPGDWGQGYPNVWLMTSVESGDPSVRDAELQAPVLERVKHLLSVPAVVHGASYEPAIGPLASELEPNLNGHGWRCQSCLKGFDEAALGSGVIGLDAWCPSCEEMDTEPDRILPGVSWVIYGGESGPGFRPEGEPGDSKKWARDMRDVCREAGVPFFHKQSAHRLNERGVELDGEVIHEYPRPDLSWVDFCRDPGSCFTPCARCHAATTQGSRP